MEVVKDLFFAERFCLYRNVVAVVGAFYILYVALGVMSSLWSSFRAFVLAPWGVSTLDLTKYGSWSIVTGSSEGIGRGYALEMARRGLNVVIISRSLEKLSKVEEEIKSKYGREVRVISIDFSKGQEVYENIQAEISDLDIAVLINNVGLSLQYPEYFADVDELRHRNIIELNCQSMTQMTHLVINKMITKKKGIIVNLSSVGADFPTPLLNVYTATKEFVRYFSRALHTEYADSGILVQCVSPGFVATAMAGIKRPRWWAPDPVKYARSAAATIGIQQHTNGCIAHAIQSYITTSLMPGWLYEKTALSSMLKAKKIILKRLAKKQ